MLASAALIAGGIMAANPATAAEEEAPVATEANPANGPEAQLSAADAALLTQLEAATNTSTGTFDAQAALAAGADPSAVADFAATYSSAGRSVVHLDAGTANLVSPAATDIVAAAATCSGARGYTGFWGWGWQTALDSCDTDLLMTSIAGGGGGIAAVGGVIAAATGPGAPAGGIVAAAGGLVAAGAGIIAICKAASREKQAIYLNVYVTGSVGCWGQ